MANDSERLILSGAGSGRPVFAATDSSAIIVGPPQSGKAHNFFNPNILEWDGPCVVAGATTEMIKATGEARKQVGPIYIYDPGFSATGFANTQRANWSPISECKDLDYAMRAANWLTAGALELVGGGSDEKSSQLMDAGKNILGPMLYAAYWSKSTMLEVCDWIDSMDTKKALSLLNKEKGEGEEEEEGLARAVAILESMEKRPAAEKTAIFAVLSRMSFAFREPGIRGENLEALNFDELLEKKATVYLCTSEQNPARTSLLFTSFVTGIVEKAWLRAATSLGVKVHSSLLLAIDDVVRACPIVNLAAVAAVGPHRGVVSLVTACDVSELAWRYGDANVSRTMASFGTQIFMSGITDAKTRQQISAHLEGRTKRQNLLKKEKESWLQLYRLMPAEEALVIRRGENPAKIKLS